MPKPHGWHKSMRAPKIVVFQSIWSMALEGLFISFPSTFSTHLGFSKQFLKQAFLHLAIAIVHVWLLFT